MNDLKTKGLKKPGSEKNLRVSTVEYLDGYRLYIVFNDRKASVVDFSDFLNNKAKGYLEKYKVLSNFKNFRISHGNVVWGKDWDLVFPVDKLYKGNI